MLRFASVFLVMVLTMGGCGTSEGGQDATSSSADLRDDGVRAGAELCEPCERTADCLPPLKCIGNICAPADSPQYCGDSPPRFDLTESEAVSGADVVDLVPARDVTDANPAPDLADASSLQDQADASAPADLTDATPPPDLSSDLAPQDQGSDPADGPCVPADEVCDGLDNDCDGAVDEFPACNNQGSPDFVKVDDYIFPPVAGISDVSGEVSAICADVDGDGASELLMLTEAEKPLNTYDARLIVFEYEMGFSFWSMLQTGMGTAQMYEEPMQMAWADRDGANGLGGAIDLFVSFYEYDSRIIHLWPWPEAPSDEYKYSFGSSVGTSMQNNHGGMVCTVPGTTPEDGRLMSSFGSIVRLDGDVDVLDLAELDSGYVPLSCAGRRVGDVRHVAISVSKDDVSPAVHRLLWFSLEDDDSLTALATVNVAQSIPPWADGKRREGELHIADANMDGLPDLFACRYLDVCQWVRVYLQEDDGGFTNSDEEHNGELGGNFDVGDVDGDGDPDIVTGKKQEVVRRNNGDGTFQPFNVQVISNADQWGETVWLCDLNGDDDPEYFQAFGLNNSTSLRVTVLKGLP